MLTTQLHRENVLISMVKIDRWTPQTWHCDPLVVVDEDGVILYADQATAEFEPSHESGILGHARVIGAEDGPTIEMTVLSRLDRPDRIPDPRLGLRNGTTMFGMDSEGHGVSWYIDGAADLFAQLRARDMSTPPRHWESLVIRDLTTGQVRFDGPAEVEKGSPGLAENIESLRVINASPQGEPMTIEVVDVHRLWPTPSVRRFGEVCRGTDAEGRDVEWICGGPKLY